ncbi:MAG: hypothetical protein IJ829_07335, partial [Kiritimatiellae bacterium]|nr:hypothetical protein [Kiritimatiellia bacterium]
MQKTISKYGLAAHLALLAVAPLFLFPFCGSVWTARTLLWLSLSAAVWTFVAPSCRKDEMPHDARARVASSIFVDPLFWFSVVLVLFAVVRWLNVGVAMVYDAEAKRVYDMAMGRVIPEEYVVATGYEAVNVPAGGKITVMTGASVLVSYGSVSLTVQSGEVINVDSAVTASNPLSANIRYFAAEDTVAVYTARQDSVCLVNGPYMLSDGAEIIENSGFDDIDEYSEYYDIVMTLADRGIMSGVSRG